MTQQRTSVGILGIGTYLPPEIRTNAWWPEHVVRRWSERRDAGRARSADVAAPPTEGMRRAAKVMETLGADPFQGARERRVMPDDMKSSEMEIRAAKEAIDRAGIDRRAIGLLLCQSMLPDYAIPNNSGLVHHALGLSTECLTIGTDAVCNTFVSQLALAEQMIAGGRTKYALLVQSSGVARLLDPAEPVSPNFGDGASAVVLGPVAEGRGIRSSQYRTEGSLHAGIVAGVRDGRWYDDRRVTVFSADAAVGRRTFLELPDMAAEVMGRALGDAGVAPTDVDFFGVHQGMSWARELLLEHLGFTNARTVETFAWAASIGAANIPLALSIAEREGLLRDEHVVAMFAGGAGLTYSAAVLRWGR